jgi:DNA repair protein RadA/Sms
VLVGGEPGIGKSTLLLQVARDMAAGDTPVLYVSGEESLEQIKLRGDRLGVRDGRLSSSRRPTSSASSPRPSGSSRRS